MFGVTLTGSTCGDACWHAKEDICRCSCGGKNHGILTRKDGKQPTRTRRIGGNFYELLAIIPRPAPGHAPIEAYRQADREIAETIKDRFPGLSQWCYGNWRQEQHMPVLSRKVSPTQAKWRECEALDTDPLFMIWARPKGTPYWTSENHKPVKVTP